MREFVRVRVGGCTNLTIYIRNIRDEAVLLSFFTENWDPELFSDLVRVSWDYDGRPIEPGQGVEFTFVVDGSVKVGVDFSFDVVVMGFLVPSVEEIDRAIRVLVEARDIHLNWVRKLEDSYYGGSEVGDVRWHLMWIERYDRIIDLLFSYRLAMVSGTG